MDQFRQAEIEQLDSTFRNKDVARLEVPMQDSPFVRRAESAGNLLCQR